MDIITRSWHTQLMQQISDRIKSIDPSGISLLMSTTIGFYIGSIILLLVDRFKRLQGIICSIGIILIGNYISKNLGVEWHIPYILLGILMGIALGSNFGDDFKNIGKKIEFKRAAKNIGIASVIYILTAFLILSISSGQIGGSFIKDAIVIIAFSYFFGEVMNFKEKGPRIFILGPGKSGKTLFLAGCYMNIINITEGPVKPSDDLLDLIDEMHSGKADWPGQTGAKFEDSWLKNINSRMKLENYSQKKLH